MRHTLSEDLLAQLSGFVAERTALHFPRERWDDLERKACSAGKEFGYADAETFVRWVVSSALTGEQMEVLASHLTINETYFWREPGVFDALGERILPELIRAREKSGRRLRIWSAGCSTGEEAYSIAISLSRALPMKDGWRVTILATDINPRMLRKAAAGVYGEWSFRNAPGWLTEDYFHRRSDGKREILPRIREMVTFAHLNLAEDLYPSLMNNSNAMDIIFCRNVLMYFSFERAQAVGRGLHDALVEGGWFIVGASELSQQLFPQFASVHFPGTIVYRKGPGAPSSTAVFRSETIPVRNPLPPEPEPEFVWDAPPDALPMADMFPCPEPAVPPFSAQVPDVISEREGIQECSVPSPVASSVRALANEGRLAAALAACDEALVSGKLEAGLHYLRATILQELDREEDAITSFKRALYLDPDFVLAHFALGNLAIRRGEVRRARRCFENVLALLTACPEDALLPESEGLTAGRFREIIHATMEMGALA